MKDLNNDNFKEIKEKEGKLLINFWAPWCPPCRMFKPILEELKGELGDEVPIYRVNIDDNQELARKLNVMSVPTTIFFENGEEVDREIGLVEKKILTSHLD